MNNQSSDEEAGISIYIISIVIYYVYDIIYTYFIRKYTPITINFNIRGAILCEHSSLEQEYHKQV